MTTRFYFLLSVLISFALACAANGAVTSEEFGKMADGTAVNLFTITNQSGAAARIMTYGAAVVSLTTPDRDGKLADIVLGYDSLNHYLRFSPFFGAIVGRYANRIGGAQFTLEGMQYHLPANDGANILHGGRRGFDKVLWNGAKVDDQTVEFTYLSKDGEEGFPGNLSVRVRYSLNDANEFKIEYSATTDKPTVINLANHSYFNLAGQGSPDILSHELMIDAADYTPVDSGLIPTGKIEPVMNTPFDFTTAHPIGERINNDNEQLRFGGGYDHNWVLTKKDGMRLAATVYEPTSGRMMEVWTDQPGLQLYSGNGLNGRIRGKEGKVYQRRSAFCIEPQHFPDSPNESAFPSTELKPDETYQSTTIYKFGARTVYDLATGWSLLKEGEAEGTIEIDAKHAINADPHQLRIAVTKTAERGKGRVGATNAALIPVQQDHWYNITFSSVTQRGSVGLVFSLEGADGKVLARTTLPEIGRGGRAQTAPGARPIWRKYLVALHARASDPAAHLTITPIEPTNIWLDGLKLTARSSP
ncbi:MAG TPA: aldose epimerase family protein [Tepidisphaeraceae bacterium]|jgi:aldose 1-epimerase